MTAASTLDLLVALARAQDRAPAASRLASALGVSSVLLLMQEQPAQPLVPVAGMAPTGGDPQSWNGLLQRSLQPGRHAERIAIDAGSVPVVVFAGDGVALACVGGEPAPADAAQVWSVLPLVGSLLRAEHALRAVAADARRAREAALQAVALAQALEKSRAEAAGLNAQLREQDRHKDEFLAMLAHELRNPLAPIVTGISLLQRKPDGSAPPDRLLALMARQATLLSRLVEDLMDVSRVNHGHIELRRQPVPLVQLVREAVDDRRDASDAKQQQLSLALPDDPLSVDGDAARLSQVFGNLLHNAVKYTAPGGHVDVAVRREGDEAVVEVSDNGVGIDAPMLPRIFGLFSQAPVPIDRAQGGIGVGLTLAHKLLQLHGGSIGVQSAGKGQGSRFTVRLPLLGAGPAQPAMRVLVVDDNADAADLVAEMLRRDGLNTQVAYDGHAALHAAAAGDPELVLLDLGLPGLDGYEVARQLRTRCGDRVQLVALTGYGAPSDRDKSRAAGFDAHCVKPISEVELREVVSASHSRLHALHAAHDI